MRGEVVGVYVGVVGCEKRRRLKEDDLVGGDVFCEVVDDVCLQLSGFVCCFFPSVFCPSCVICKYVDDDDVVVFVCCAFDLLKSL